MPELQKVQKISNNKIIQKQLQMRMIKKSLKKDIFLQKKENNIIGNLNINVIV